MKPSRLSENRSGKNSFNIFMSGDLEGFIEDLKGDVLAAARPAAQAGAEVLYQAVLQNVESIGSRTGNLRKSIYQAFSKDLSGPGYATYHISWRTSGSGVRAMHGHLVEFGHIQRYASYIGKDGKWYTAVKPEHYKQKAPWIGTGKNGRNRKATRTEMDAWYVPRPGGPVQVAARPFIRPASQRLPEAVEAAEAKMLEVLGV